MLRSEASGYLRSGLFPLPERSKDRVSREEKVVCGLSSEPFPPAHTQCRVVRV